MLVRDAGFVAGCTTRSSWITLPRGYRSRVCKPWTGPEMNSHDLSTMPVSDVLRRQNERPLLPLFRAQAEEVRQPAPAISDRDTLVRG